LDILKHLVTESDDSNGQPSQFSSSSCPFLGKDEGKKTYSCTINDTKPFYCKNYPDDGVCEYVEESYEEPDWKKNSTISRQE
jgi:Fe-S-cluster containining protein